MSNLLLSVVIPHGCIDRPIIRCVSSVNTQSLKRCKYEIIVVLDGIELDVETLRVLLHFGCKVIKNKKAGVCTSRNTGIITAESELVVLLDDDCIADVRMLEEYYMYFLNNMIVAGVGGTVLPMEATSMIAKYAAYRKLLSKPLMQSNEVYTIITANSAFRKDALMKVGLFETQLDRYFGTCGGDDVDLSYKLKEAGYKLGYCPQAIVSHKHREKMSSFVCQQIRNGKGLYAHSYLRGLNLTEFGMPAATIPCILWYTVKFLVRSHPISGKCLTSRILSYYFDKNLKWRQKYAFVFFDIIKILCYYYGIYNAKRLISSFQYTSHSEGMRNT